MHQNPKTTPAAEGACPAAPNTSRVLVWGALVPAAAGGECSCCLSAARASGLCVLGHLVAAAPCPLAVPQLGGGGAGRDPTAVAACPCCQLGTVSAAALGSERPGGSASGKFPGERMLSHGKHLPPARRGAGGALAGRASGGTRLATGLARRHPAGLPALVVLHVRGQHVWSLSWPWGGRTGAHSPPVPGWCKPGARGWGWGWGRAEV